MATVYVIHAEQDALFLDRVLEGLPTHGYDYWLSRKHLDCSGAEEDAIVQAMEQCLGILVVLSPAILGCPTSMKEIDIALVRRPLVIVVEVTRLDEAGAGRLPAKLWALPKVDLTGKEGEDALRLLSGLLPPVHHHLKTMAPEGAERIGWNESIFTAELASATHRHDHARAAALVGMMVGHLKHRPDSYPPEHAYKDLQTLRQEREFALMRRYGEAVIASGTREDRVRRMLAQALIETKRYGRAHQVLRSIMEGADSSQEEVYEAHGLLGRTFKQRYIDAPDKAKAAPFLQKAINAYEEVYNRDSHHFWHGVNAASCMLRAERDGIPAAGADRAQEIARKIVADLDLLAQKEPLAVWDCASRVEALIALGKYGDAERALGDYINHPAMTAFEVSSTFRQFDQVLELGRKQGGETILDRLRTAVERYRAGSITARPARAADTLAAESVSAAPPTRPLIIRLSESDWKPDGVPDLVVQARLGKIVTARGSDRSVRELLTDLTVISVEESRPAGRKECARSIPFIKVAEEYPAVAGNYKETGDHALIAIIDDGIDVLHKAFLDASGKSRIVGIWDQTAAGGPPPAQFGYENFKNGTFHDEAAIAGYVAAVRVPPGLGRNDDHGHGTHVASIAAGRRVGEFAGGVAPDAQLLVVIADGNGAIGYSQSYIEALSFIDCFASRRNLPVVVNLSQGMNAGAHDGKSMLEVAFDEFSLSGRKRGRVVVKSAGNERSSGGHAKVTIKPNSLQKLRWERQRGADYVERIEVWGNSANDVRFRLRDPFMDYSEWVGSAAPVCKGTFSKGGPYHLVFTKRHVDNGDSMLSIDLGDATGAAAIGEWELEILGAAVPVGGAIHCWIERSQGAPSKFLNHFDEEMTITIPGTASSVIAVGAIAASLPIEEHPDTSYGPTRNGQNKPLLCAPGVAILAAKSGTEEGVCAKDGTSMAAPHVTGAIALLLSRAAKVGKMLGGNQIESALRDKTQNYNGVWDRGQGYGVIDVAALLAAFE